ncbi:MAG TPA: phenylalanine--tRNA ligase subunit beta [Clostridia bacterium]|nr:phenylalanine--tRNA ligase subunit beta [Clostridia bacterium]
MLVPVKWLKDYVDIDITTKELADAMILTGSNVEGVEELGKDIENVVVGKIISIDSHPNADKLIICKVDVGNELLQIVTGATNVREGQLVPVAVDGAVLPGGTRITAGELRGESSQGMMCSIEELSLEEFGYIQGKDDGILVLDGEYSLGMDIREALKLKDEVIEFEITPNRADCLSMVGIAREAAVTFGKDYRLPEITVEEENDRTQDLVKVIVEDEELCPRYCARVIKDVIIEPSPLWMRSRLSAAGIRPINNIVDITNYVMLELGQPMHAFDLDKVSNKTIVVRKGKEGELLETLDKQNRDLTQDMLVIADKEKAIGIAGVMGGFNTEISQNTRDIVLESAKFDGGSIRLTSKALGLRSEASNRFEKGVDIVNVETAIDRAAQLIHELGAGRVMKGKVDVCTQSLEPRAMKASCQGINALLGIDIGAGEMCEILESLSFKVEVDGDILKVEIPSFRQDVEIMEDLAEEIARIYGYNRIPMTLMGNSVAQGARTREQVLTQRAKEVLTGMGLFETVTYSFYSPNIYKRIGFEPHEYPDILKIANPLGEDQSAMRTTLIPNILEVLSRNRNRSLEECRIFEISNIFIPKAKSEDLPIEELTLGIGQYGKDIDFYEIKGQLELLFDVFQISQDIEFLPHVHPSFHPGRTAAIKINGEIFGVVGEIHPKVCQNYELNTRILIAELNFDTMLKEANLERNFKHLPKYPAIERDLAMVVDNIILASSIERQILESGGSLLEKVELFDIYEGDQIPENHRSMAYSLSYRTGDRTLKDKEVNVIHDRIIRDLKEKFDANLRS